VDKESLKEILRLHGMWLRGDSEGERANLRNADLRGADLSDTDLRNANLSDTDLRNADLRGADLRNANLRGADLRNANLSDTDLRNADLSDTDLRNADLRGANLRNADLRGADLPAGWAHASVGWSAHGERGRTLLAVRDAERNVALYCGCFRGPVADLRAYIARGEECYRASRSLALDVVLMLLAECG
jgi:hypothetical protein